MSRRNFCCIFPTSNYIHSALQVISTVNATPPQKFARPPYSYYIRLANKNCDGGGRRQKHKIHIQLRWTFIKSFKTWKGKQQARFDTGNWAKIADKQVYRWDKWDSNLYPDCSRPTRHQHKQCRYNNQFWNLVLPFQQGILQFLLLFSVNRPLYETFCEHADDRLLTHTQPQMLHMNSFSRKHVNFCGA